LIDWGGGKYEGIFMRTNHHIFLLILILVVFQACSSTDSSRGPIDGTEISALAALGRMETAPPGPLYTGDGGENIRLAILVPQIQGVVPTYLPIYIQGLLNNNFNKYSAINLIDRQNLDRIIAEQKIAANGSYSDNDFVRIGNLTNAQYFLFGTIQKLSGDRYALQLSITDSSTGVRKANFMKDGSLTQLEGNGTLINEATADLLAQLGIQLTETGKQTLLAGNTSAVKAEAGLARGITAQADGSEIEALFNYTQAIIFDPSRIEALSRLNTLSSTISGGTISQRIMNDIQARDRWLDVFKETTLFFNEHPPFEIIFDPNLMQIGETDYAKRTANIGMRIVLDSSQAGFEALNTLLEGLEKTGKRENWGFSGWPLMELSPITAGTVVLDGRRSFSSKVDVALINENNKTIGNGSIFLTTEIISFSAGDKIITPPSSVGNVVSFSDVRADDLTPTLTIVIVAVNGIPSREINASGYMKIETGDLEPRAREFFERGKRNAEIGDINRAIADYTQAIQFDPNDVKAYYSRGIAYHDKKNYDMAIADYTQTIKLDPNSANAYNDRGVVYNDMGDYNMAIADYTAALGIELDYGVLYNRGIAYSNKKDYDRAIADYTQAIKLNPNYANAYHDRGFVYYNIKDYDRAIADYTQVIKLDPNFAYAYSAYYNRGLVYYNRKDYDRAIVDYTQAIKLNPNYANAYFNRGLAYVEKLDYGLAYVDKMDYNRVVADFEAALRIEPNNANYKQALEIARGE
jgi:tetratricopeptide (TPR) repeat protein